MKDDSLASAVVSQKFAAVNRKQTMRYDQSMQKQQGFSLSSADLNEDGQDQRSNMADLIRQRDDALKVRACSHYTHIFGVCAVLPSSYEAR